MATAIGLDLGQDTLRVAVLRSSGTTITLARYLCIPLSELREDGCNTEDHDALALAVSERLTTAGLPTTMINVSISGRDSIIRYSHLPSMPAWRLRLIMEYEITEIAEKSGEQLTADYTIVPAQSLERGFSVLVALAKDRQIAARIAALSKTQLDIASALPCSVAVGDAMRFLGDPSGKGYTLVVDIGRRSSEVAVLDAGNLVFARSIPMGGELFTEKLMEAFELERDEAEEVKLARKGPQGEPIGPTLRPAMQQLSNLVKSSLRYMKGQLKLGVTVKPQAIYVTGGGARLPALAMTLGETLRCPAKVWDPLAGIETGGVPAADRAAVESDGVLAGPACGLAVQRLVAASSQLDLLPNELRARRTWRHRTVWLIAAAAILLVQATFSLGLALHRRSSELERSAQLASIYGKQVRARDAAQKTRQDENERRESALSALASRVRPGRQLNEFLEIVARVLPENMTIQSIELRSPKAAQEQTGISPAPVASFLVVGEVDNAQLRCEQELAQLEEVLRAEPALDGARIVPTGGTENPRVSFQMTVTPKGAE